MNQISTQQQGYNNISTALKSASATNRIATALGIDPTDEKAKAAVVPYASSVLIEIERNFGDSKKDMTGCVPDSIVRCVVDAARFKIMIDGRQHAHLVKYGQNATLQIGYRGFVHKIQEHLPDADFHYKAIFEGDTFTVNTKDGYDEYSHVIADPLEDDIKKLKGVYVAISYNKGDKHYQAVTVMSKNMINKIKSKAKQTFIWDEWYIEKAIVACIKRASKIHFAGIKELAEMVNFDNKTNFTPYANSSPEGQTATPFETMNKIKDEKEAKDAPIENETAVDDDTIDGTAETVIEDTPDQESLIDQESEGQMRQAIYKAISGIKDEESLNEFYTLYDGEIQELPAEDQKNINNTLNKTKERLGLNA